MRADVLLVQRGLAPSRSAAQRLIATGAVRCLGRDGWSVPRKSGDELPEHCEIEITDDAELRWASRAGLKLEGALDHTQLDVRARACLDIGQSTGGFTDVLLARGAASVVGIDVGHGQLVARLRADARVTALEGINARALDASILPRPRFDLVVADLSFISLTLVLPAVAPLIGADALLLVKPQFEGQPGDALDDAALRRVEARIRGACGEARLEVHDWFASPITGGDGNHEFFVHATGDHRS